MHYLTRNILVITFIVFSLAGCAKKADKKVLARIDKEYTITLADFNNRIEQLPPRYKELVTNNKKKFLEELIIDTLLYNEAISERMDRDPEVKRLIEEARRKIIIAKLLKDKVEDKALVTEDEIKEYYDANPEKFTMLEKLRASHILVKTEPEARDILVELSNGRNFEDLARSRSVDPTAKTGGDIGYFTKNQLVPEVEEVCFDMKVGETSGIVRTKFGYHVLKLTERQEPRIKELSEVHDGIEQLLLRLKKKMIFNEFVESLRGKSQITINNDLLDTISKKEKQEEKP